ncbi:hypothetical protein D9M70_328080 [compost metagenome]
MPVSANALRGRAAVSSTRAGAWPLKQQSRMHKTARAFVVLKVSAKPVIDKAVPARSLASVSNNTRLPSGEPCPANAMTTTSSALAAAKVPSMESETSACVAASSTSRRALRPSTVSVNNAHNAVASRRAPLNSGMELSRCLLMPTKIALIAMCTPYSIRARSCSITLLACRCRNARASRCSDSSPSPSSNLATDTGPSLR